MELNIGGLSFEELVSLYNDDPVAFEQFRMQLLEDEIGRAPEALQDRLRATVHGTEMRLARFGTGIARFNAVVPVLFEGLSELNDVLHGKHPVQVGQGGTVVPFHARWKSDR